MGNRNCYSGWCFGFALIIAALSSLLSAQPNKPDPIKGTKYLLKGYDRFKDQTVIMTKEMMVGATTGGNTYFAGMTAVIVFPGKDVVNKIESVGLVFDPDVNLSAGMSFLSGMSQDLKKKVFFNHDAEIIALIDEQRMPLPKGDKPPTLFSGSGSVNNEVGVMITPDQFKKMAGAEKLEFMVGDVIIQTAMKKYGKGLVELSQYIDKLPSSPDIK